MLLCHWDRETGWERPKIVPYGDIPMSPALSALHYATEVSLVTILKVYVIASSPGHSHFFKVTLSFIKYRWNCMGMQIKQLAESFPHYSIHNGIENFRCICVFARPHVPKISIYYGKFSIGVRACWLASWSPDVCTLWYMWHVMICTKYMYMYVKILGRVVRLVASTIRSFYTNTGNIRMLIFCQCWCKREKMIHVLACSYISTFV